MLSFFLLLPIRLGDYLPFCLVWSSLWDGSKVVALLRWCMSWGHIGRNQTSRSSSHPGHTYLIVFIMQIKELIYASHYTWPSPAHRYKCKLGTIIHRLRIKSLAQPKTKPTSQQPCQDLEGFKWKKQNETTYAPARRGMLFTFNLSCSQSRRLGRRRSLTSDVSDSLAVGSQWRGTRTATTACVSS